MKRLVLLCALLLSGSNVFGEIVAPRKTCEGTQFQLRVCADENLMASDAKIREELPPELATKWEEATTVVCEERWKDFKTGSIYPMMILKCNDNLNRVLLKEFEPFGN